MAVPPYVQTALNKALGKLTQDWKGKLGITSVVLQNDSTPIFFLQGPERNPPLGLPSFITVQPSPQHLPKEIPIRWRQDTPASTNQTLPLKPSANADLNRSMWNFWTPEEPKEITVVRPATHVPYVPVVGEPPKVDDYAGQLAVDARLPQYNIQNFWSRPFEPFACICCTFYATRTLVYSYQVPQDYLLVLDGISLEVPSFMVPGEIIEVTILRDQSPIIDFEEMVVDPLNPDPARRCLYTSSIQPNLPWQARFDRNQRLNVALTFKGLFPFSKTSADTFCGTTCILLHGWLGSLMDNRDGAARPVDPGDYRDQSTLKDLEAVTPEQVAEMQAWLAGTVAMGKRN